MDIKEWYKKNTFHYSQFNVEKLLNLKNKKGLTISLCFPTLNEAKTIGSILKVVERDLYKTGLVDEVFVIDSDSTDLTHEIVKSSVFKFIKHKNILKNYGTFKGKGEALWKSIFITKGDLIVWCDADIENFNSRFIYGILGPLIENDKINFVKAFYRRPLKVHHSYIKEEGGRVTEILVKPILNLFYPQLSMIFQPLAGEYAGRRSLFEQLPFFTGYGVEIGLLIDIYEKMGLEAIAQVDVLRRIHRNQPISSLSKMSFGILQAIFQKLQQYNKLILVGELNKIFRKVDYINKEYIITPVKIIEKSRPPMIEVKEYILKNTFTENIPSKKIT